MAQNITLLNANYSDVPAVELPKTGGGVASFTDVTDTTATAEDVAQGKYFYNAAGVKTAGTSSGGGTTEPTPLDVDFIDYDGTILYTYTADDFLNLDALPTNPSHAGLIAQGWNWTLADAKAHVAAYKYLVIGQNYTTDTGETRVYVTYDDVSAQCRQFIKYYGTVKGGVTVDWGDGTTVTPTTNANALTSITHTYGTPGSYVIRIKVNSGTIKIGYNGSNSGFLFEPTTDAYFTRGATTKIEIGDNVTQSYRSTFLRLVNLETITIPKDFNAIDPTNGSNAFEYCASLKGLVLSKATTTIKASAFRYSEKIKNISIPKETTTIEASAFAYAGLRKITIASANSLGASCFNNIYAMRIMVVVGTYTSIPQYCFQSDERIDNAIIIPETVTTIANQSFGTTYVNEYHLRPTTPPTLSNANAFYNATNMKMYVPYSEDHSILAAYQAASNWATFASKMIEEPE